LPISWTGWFFVHFLPTSWTGQICMLCLRLDCWPLNIFMHMMCKFVVLFMNWAENEQRIGQFVKWARVQTSNLASSWNGHFHLNILKFKGGSKV
jgi:hypothetical protein